tara:strand:- start:406 stop:570 length:165 start_codon:yes stop_codon:yes gene_type:complete
MVNTNQKNKNKFVYLLNLAVLILIIFFNGRNLVYGANNNWVEVGKSDAGIQYVE